MTHRIYVKLFILTLFLSIPACGSLDEKKEVTYLETTQRFYHNLWISIVLYLAALLVGTCNFICNRRVLWSNGMARIRMGFRSFKRLIGLKRRV